MNKRTLGTQYEEAAAEFLTGKGYQILARNFRSRSGEIDLIGMDGAYLVFIEVKYRKTMASGAPEYAVDRHKRRQISRTAALFLIRNRIPDSQPCRFDVVAIAGNDFHLYKNAFLYEA